MAFEVPEYARQDNNTLFDREFYLSRYADVRESGIEPFEHYLLFGFAERREPCSRDKLLAYMAETGPEVSQTAIHTSSALNGNLTVLDHDPDVLELSHHVCCPQNIPNCAPGIFDFGRKLIGHSCYSRGPLPAAVVPNCSLPFGYDAVREYADDETYIYLGPVHPHFGHFLISTLSRLWQIKTLPSHKIIYYAGGLQPGAMSPSVQALFRAFGVEPDRLVAFDRPLKVRNLLLPCPCIEEQNFVHKVFSRSYNQAGDRLAEASSVSIDGAGPIYLSKARMSDGVRKIMNEDVIDGRLADAGFSIVYPETLTIEDQVALWRLGRPMIAFSGSSLHLSAFTTNARITSLRWDDQIDTTFPLVDWANDHQSQYLHFEPGAFVELGPTPHSNGIGGLSSRLMAVDPIAVADAIVRAVGG